MKYFQKARGSNLYDFANLVEDTKPDVLVDLTNPHSVYEHTKQALEHNVRPVVGTTGFTDEQLEELTELATRKKIGCYYCTKLCNWCDINDEVCTRSSKIFTRC